MVPSFTNQFEGSEGAFSCPSDSLREGDMVFVSTSPASELMKFLTVVNSAVAPVANGAYLYNTVR